MSVKFLNTATKESVETSKNQSVKHSKKERNLSTEEISCSEDCYEKINMTSFKKSFSKLHQNYISEN